MINYLTVKDLVDSLDKNNFFTVSPNWTLSKAVSYLIKNNIYACPVSNTPKNGKIAKINGYFFLQDITLKT